MVWEKKDFEILCMVISKLKYKSEYLWRNGQNADGAEIGDNLQSSYYALIDRKRPLRFEELEKLIDEAKDPILSWNKTHFYLPPLNDPDFVPTLRFECNFSEPNQTITFRVELNRFKDDGKTQLFVFGFRFETGLSGSGHDYYHVQISTRPRPSERLYPGCSGFIPTSIPCLPAVANCPISLLFYMLISFYGKGIYNKLFPPDMMEYVKQYLEPLKKFL